MFLAEYYTSDESIKKMCRYYRSKAPWMPQPEGEFIPYSLSFGCNAIEQMFEWFGYDFSLLRKVLTVLKLIFML